MNHARDTVIRVVLWCGIILFIAVLIPRLHRELPLNDFIEYWSAERLFVNGHNPYSASEVLDVQHGSGWESPQPLMMFNPPWILPLLAPLAALPFRTAQIFWLIVSVALLFLSTFLLWRYYGGTPDRAVVASVCAILFFPNPVALRMGQLAPLILFGLAAFLLCVRHKRFWLAGVSLFTLGIKPHLLIPVAVVVVLWTIRERRWQIIGGTMLATAIATAAVAVINPIALSGYIDLWRSNPPVEFVSGLGGVLRLMFGFERTWLQMVPAAIGLVWVLIHWIRYRARWDWGEQMPSLVLGSLISAPYGWTFDQPVAMVAMVSASVAIYKRNRTRIVAAFVLGNVIMAGMIAAGLTESWLLWSAPLWALLYRWAKT